MRSDCPSSDSLRITVVTIEDGISLAATECVVGKFDPISAISNCIGSRPSKILFKGCQIIESLSFAFYKVVNGDEVVVILPKVAPKRSITCGLTYPLSVFINRGIREGSIREKPAKRMIEDLLAAGELNKLNDNRFASMEFRFPGMFMRAHRMNLLQNCAEIEEKLGTSLETSSHISTDALPKSWAD